MFRGYSSINLDDKGRLAVPTRYREQLQACCERQLVVTLAVDERCAGQSGCLWLYPLPEWEKLEETISKQPTLNKMASKLRRFVIGNAIECKYTTFLKPKNCNSDFFSTFLLGSR